MGIYMGDLILGVILQYTVYACFSCFSQVIKSYTDVHVTANSVYTVMQILQQYSFLITQLSWGPDVLKIS